MSPYEAIYAELREELVHWPELPAELADPLQLHHESQRVFALAQPFRAVSSAELGSMDDASIMVLEGLRFGSDLIVACHDPRPFEDFVRYHPRRPQHAPRDSSGSGAKLSATVADLLLQECPWLDREDLSKPKSRPSLARPGHAHPGAPQHDRPPHAESDEEGVVVSSSSSDGEAPGGDDGVDVGLVLAGLRAGLVDEGDDAEPYFRVQIRGGCWTLEHRDAIGDCAMAKYIDAETRYWCQAYGFPASKSFSFRLYGREGSLHLAREFARRGNYFAALYFDSVNDDWEYSPDHVAACGDDLPFLDWICSLDIEDPSFVRGQEVRATAPYTT
jgi:hypothetical protein